MMKKIIYTGAFRFPNGDAASQRVLNNAKIFRELGYTVEFLSWGGTPREEDRADDGFYYYQGFRYVNTGDIDKKNISILNRITRFFFDGKNTLRIMYDKKDLVDIVIGYNPSLYFSKKLISFCKSYDKLLITDVDEWFSPNDLPGGLLAPPVWVNELNMRIFQKKIKNKILISKFLQSYYIDSQSIVLPPLVDEKDKKWECLSVKLNSFDGIRFIYAGTPANKKDMLDTMLLAVAETIKNGLKIQFLILGLKLDDIHFYESYNIIKNMPQNFIFFGKIPQVDVPSYYSQSNFSILIRENSKKNMAGFPTKFVESMMAGCPVICNATSDIKEYIKDGHDGIIVNGISLEEIKNVIYRVATMSNEVLLEMKENARKTSLSKFEYKNYIEEFKKYLFSIK